MEKSLSYYKQYAKKCIIEGRTNTRAFDSCFENGKEIADQVVKFLVEKALSVDDLQKKLDENQVEKSWRAAEGIWKLTGCKQFPQFSISDAEYRAHHLIKVALLDARRLKTGLENLGVLAAWSRRVNVK